jgi:hypothetical protein
MSIRKKSMRFTAVIGALAVFTGTAPFASGGDSRWRLDLETGAVFSGYNDVGIPGDTGTRFSLSEDFKTAAGAFVRVRLSWRIGSRHTLSVLYAPLRLSASGTSKFPISFFGEDFPAGADVKGTYVFNSYRLSYRYDLVNKDTWRLGFGFTAKIRDAAIRLKGAGRSAEKTNIGFVPLLNARLEGRLSPEFSLLLDVDALAAPQGRAEDVLVAVLYRLSPALTLRAGYRFVEGGADNAEVYNFALIHCASIGVLIDF